MKDLQFIRIKEDGTFDVVIDDNNRIDGFDAELQMFINNLYTTQGTDRLNPDRGSSLKALIRQSFALDEAAIAVAHSIRKAVDDMEDAAVELDDVLVEKISVDSDSTNLNIKIRIGTKTVNLG